MLIALKRLQKFSLDPYFCLPVPVALCRRRMFVLKSTFFCGRDRTFDNLNTHTNEAARKWLKSHPLVSFHYTPTHASWVNLIECFSSILTRQRLQQAVHQSGKELEAFLKSFIQEYNKRCGPFAWKKGPNKLRRIIELTEQWQSQ